MCFWVALTCIAHPQPLEMLQLRGSHSVAPRTAASRQCSSWGLLVHVASLGDLGMTRTLDAANLPDRGDWMPPSL
eukprot:9493436-Pyramimonas_sp.AAC.1